MSTNPQRDLAIAQLAFFAPSLVLALAINFRHDFTRASGWIYLIILSLIRIVGASVELYILLAHDYSRGLLETAAVTSFIGLAPLLFALDGILTHVNKSFATPDDQKRATRPLLLIRTIILVGLVLSIVGAVYQPVTPALYKAGNIGTDLSKASSILFGVAYLALAALTMPMLLRKHSAGAHDRLLIYAAAVGLVPLLVRVAYSILVAFYVGNDFFYRSVNIWVQSLMQFLPEALVVVMFLIAGLVAPRPKK